MVTGEYGHGLIRIEKEPNRKCFTNLFFVLVTSELKRLIKQELSSC